MQDRRTRISDFRGKATACGIVFFGGGERGNPVALHRIKITNVVSPLTARHSTPWWLTQFS